MQTAVYPDEWSRARGEANTTPSEHEHDEMSVPTVEPFRRESGAAVEEPVSSPERRLTDVSRSGLNLPMVAGVIVFAAAMMGSFWAINNRTNERMLEMQSDVREIRTRMEMQSQINDANKRSDVLLYENLNSSVDELRRQTQLLQLQYAELSKQMKK